MKPHVFRAQREGEAKEHTDGHAPGAHVHKLKHGEEEGLDGHLSARLGKPIDSPEEDDSNGVIQYGFAKDEVEQRTLDLEVLEDGDCCDWINCADECSEQPAFDKGEAVDAQEGRDVAENGDAHGRYQRAGDGKERDGADVAEEERAVLLVQRVAGVEDDWREEDREEDLRRECNEFSDIVELSENQSDQDAHKAYESRPGAFRSKIRVEGDHG